MLLNMDIMVAYFLTIYRNKANILLIFLWCVATSVLLCKKLEKGKSILDIYKCPF